MTTHQSALEPFDLSNVRLTGRTAQTAAASLNTEYLLETLDPHNLLWNFWTNAGLKTKGTPYYHSWEDPTCELRGHFTGHYLTALSYVWRATGNEQAKTRLQYMIAELAKVQASLGGGYLSAFPTELFDRLQGLQRVWAPYYTIHKIMAGLLDSYNLVGIDQALTVVKDMAAYFLGRIDNTIKVNGTDHWIRMLDEEFGGMNDVMYNLYKVTQDPEHLRMAHLFDKPRFYDPLVKGWDPLPELHANTHLAQVVGFVSRFEVTQDADARKAVTNFLNILTKYHSYVTGGNNYNEHWYGESWLGDAILSKDNSSFTEETCTQYNLLKILRGMFQFTRDPQLADWYERAILNGIMGVSRIPYNRQPQVEGKPKPSAITVSDDPDAHSAEADAKAEASEINLDLKDELEEAALSDDDDQDTMEGHDSDETTSRRLLTADTLGEKRDSEAGSSRPHQAQRDVLHARDHGHHDHVHKDGVHDMTWHTGGHAHGVHSRMHKGIPGLMRRHLHMHMHMPDHMPGHIHDHGHPSGGVEDWGHAHGQRISNAGRLLLEEQGAELEIPYLQVTPVHERMKRPPFTSEFIGFNEPDPSKGMVDGAGPGRYIYMLPLGIGQTKGDGGHHWGFPKHSFWCCYGTAVESFAKLHDSIWFRNSSANPKELLLTQLTPNVLTWKEVGLQAELTSDMHGPGLTATANLSITLLDNRDSLDLSLSVRIPVWTNATTGGILLNGKVYTGCAAGFEPGTFCTITRSWQTGDSVSMHFPYTLWFEQLNDKRLEYRVMQGLMMGPFTMAGLTHHHNHLAIDETQLQNKVVDPPTSKIITLKAAWNESLVVRHDQDVMYVSSVMDGSDASDAVFRVYHGCSPNHRKAKAGQPMAEDAELVEEDPVMLEALNTPGHFVGYLADKAVLGIVNGNPEDVTFCQEHSFVFEKPTSHDDVVLLRYVLQVGKHASYLSAYQRPPSPDTLDGGETCSNKHEKCEYWASRDECDRNPTYMMKECRIACGLCPMTSIALGLPEAAADDTDVFLATSQFTITPALVDLPLGSKILIGDNRKYVIAPLGNVIEERYTVYFNLTSTATVPAALA